MIEVSNLVKKYGDHTAVDHLSFQIEKGKIYGFLGPNGAGKSTTMNMITGYIASTEGKVMIDGHDILEEPEAAKKCIGYLPEMPPLYFDMTVLEYMKFAADLKKIPRNQKDKQIKEVMDMVKITDMKDRLIKNLSKGYRQRVGLAQAILGYPEVIILDEPTVGLDPKQIIEIRDLIKGLKQKHTVILSSHILSEVRAVCDYVLIISHGKLVASDTPDNLERLAAGSNSLLMKVKGEKDTIRKALETIEGVTGVEMSYDSDEKLWKTKLSIQENVDIREKVFYAMAKANCPIYEMQVKRVSLEDVFLELTEGEKKSAGKPESALTFVFLIGVPILSMRVLAEERKQKTDQLLLTAPVSVWDIVFGKYLALVAVFAIPVVIMCVYPLIMSKFGTISYASAYTGILGFFLLGCANLAIGVFMSALTESQVIAAVLTFVFLFAFYMMNGISSFFSQTSMSTAVAFGLLIVAIAIIIYTMIKNVLISVVIGAVGEIALVIVYVVKSSIFQGGIQKVLNVFNLSGHYDNFTKGVFDVTGIVYFISVIAICLFLTMQSIQKRRWN